MGSLICHREAESKNSFTASFLLLGTWNLPVGKKVFTFPT